MINVTSSCATVRHTFNNTLNRKDTAVRNVPAQSNLDGNLLEADVIGTR